MGSRHARNLWRINMPTPATPIGPLPEFSAQSVMLLHHSAQPDAEHIRFVHACLGSPTPTIFLRAVAKGYINGKRQFPRLTTKLVKRYMPISEATARGHLRKSQTQQPHAKSQSVSALRRHHNASVIQSFWKSRKSDPNYKPSARFDVTKVGKSNTLHLDYTGAFPERLSSGALYLIVSCYDATSIWNRSPA
jgi:hypothetical protein